MSAESNQDQPTSVYTINRWTTYVERVLLVLAVLVSLRLRLFSEAFANDDALMTFRVVDNLLIHGEFNYNLGEHVYSSTTPLFVLLMASIQYLTSLPAHSFYLWILVAFDVCNMGLLYYVGRHATGRSSLGGVLCVWFYALSWSGVLTTLTGLEAPLLVFLILTTLTFHQHQSERLRSLAPCIAALACITRPEGTFLFASLFLYECWASRRLVWKEFVAGGCILLLWTAFALSYFGTVVPHASKGKTIGYLRADDVAVTELVNHFAGMINFPMELGWVSKLLICLFVLAGFYGARKSLKTEPKLAVIYGFAGFFIAAYAIKNPLVAYWYLPPLEIPYILALAAALIAFSQWLEKHLLIPAVLVIALLLALPLSQYPWKSCPVDSYRNSWLTVRLDNTGKLTTGVRTLMGPDLRETLYEVIAKDLANEVSAKDTVLATDFGMLGYYLPAKMLSTLGHVNPEMLKYLPAERTIHGYSSNPITPEMVQGECPDYIIAHEFFYSPLLLQSSWFSKTYSQIRFYEAPIYKSKGVYVHKRNSAECG